MYFQAGLHFDPQYWPDPLVFDPDRFSSENKSNIDSITFQTFGFGPRFVNTLNGKIYVSLQGLLGEESLSRGDKGSCRSSSEELQVRS